MNDNHGNIVEIENLSFTYGGQKKALDNVSLSIGPGATGLLGLNGAGKTTIIQILLGLLPLQSGRIKLFGKSGPLSVESKKWVGYMPETTPLIPGMSGAEMVAYLARLAGLPDNEALARAHEALFYVNLGGDRYRQVSQYSDGMKQRLKLAQSIVHGPRLVILDEPTNGLDPIGREEILKLIGDLKRKGLSVVLCSHLLPDVEATCDSVIVLHQGRVAATQQLDRKGTSRLEVRVREGRDAFAEALGGHPSLTGLPDMKISLAKDDLLILDPAPSDTRPLFELARRLGLQIRHLLPLHPTLEDFFVETLARGQ